MVENKLRGVTAWGAVQPSFQLVTADGKHAYGFFSSARVGIIVTTTARDRGVRAPQFVAL